MKRPWQIWLIFVACLAVVIPALVWLTRIALQLDYQQRLAQSRAELDEVAANVLWQTDAALTRVIAPETARPHYVYQSLWTLPNSNGRPATTISPLLLERSPFVRIHFQIDSSGRWSSPQCADGLTEVELRQWGIEQQDVIRAQQQLTQLRASTTVAEILARVILPAMQQEVEITDGVSATSKPVVNNRFVENWLRSNSIDSGSSVPLAQNTAGGKGVSAEQVQETAEAFRRGKNLQQRSDFFQAQAQQELTQQNLSYNLLNSGVAPLEVTEGPSEIFWRGNNLFAARQTVINGERYIQGCWFDWEKLHEQIVKNALDALPAARVEPVRENSKAGPLRMLAVVPAKLVVPEPAVVSKRFSAVHWALIIAWSLLALAAISTATLLHGVVALSERRASFVSAVTHELRTPLTTFRLYSEMLAEGMVSAERRATYLETLQREAERLSHLVENVLQYARLERGAARRRKETITIAELIERIQPALARRAEQAEMKLEVSVLADAGRQTLVTDCGVVEQILFNLVDNSCKYAARSTDRRIHCEMQRLNSVWRITVRDHGPGISARSAKRLFYPFRKSAEQAAETAPGVGLGLALCKRLAKQIDGRLEWLPSDEGAVFQLTLPAA